jgi:mannose-6-phosphate isomerase-like protein (cupin superfamily)
MGDKMNITPGIIESYCLGLLDDEQSRMVEGQAKVDADLRSEMDAFMLLLEECAMDNAVDAGEDVRASTLSILDNLKLEDAKDVHDLPLLNKFSDPSNWLHIVEPMLPNETPATMFVHELRNDDGVSQTLIWTSVNYPDEVHEDEEECFIILKGRCRCYIENTVVELGPGGFLEIPMFKHHDVKVLEPVLAVVQRVKVA